MVQYENYDRSNDGDNDERATSPELWRPLSEALGMFDLDPCSGCEPVQIAAETFTEEENGLAHPWFGRVFVNPPFSEKDEWYAKCTREIDRPEVHTIVCIFPGDTSPAWFHNHVSTADVLAWLRGRGWYVGNGSPNFNSGVAVWGDCPDELLTALEEIGTVTFTAEKKTKQTRL